MARVSLLLVLVLAAACGSSAAPDAGAPDLGAADLGATDLGATDLGAPDAGTWTGWPACDTGAVTQRLTFVHINDLHAHYAPDAHGVSPWARVRGFYERTRLASPYTIFTDGGDDHEKGSVVELVSAGRSTVDLVRAMQFDVRVLGNHDFAWSLDELLDFSHDDHAAVLCANERVTGADASRYGAVPFATLQVGCLRVGFGGLVSKPWDEHDRQIDEPFYPEMTGDYDYVAQAQALVDAHRADVDVLVLVDHIGLSEDESVARMVPGIDVILSGHSHSLTPTPDMVGETIVIQSGSFADFVLRLDVDVDLATHAVSVADFRVGVVGAERASATMQAAVDEAVRTYAPDAYTPIGQLSATLDAPHVADFAARAARGQLGTDAAVIDEDTVWGALHGGDVSEQSYADAFRVERERAGTPGFNAFYTATLTGAALRALVTGRDARYHYDGPDAASITDASSYTITLQKRFAMHPDEYLPAGVVLSGAPVAVGEVWETLAAWTRARRAACLYADASTALPACP